MSKPYVSVKEALQKAKHYCAYQERCHSEVKEKLFGMGITAAEADPIISTLIEENYLNEERFALMYAGGHFRTKKWGKVKISYELKKKQVSAYCIKSALAAIDETDYFNTLQKLAELKLLSLRSEKNIFKKKRLLHDHLTSKGYEASLVTGLVQQLLK